MTRETKRAVKRIAGSVLWTALFAALVFGAPEVARRWPLSGDTGSWLYIGMCLGAAWTWLDGRRNRRLEIRRYERLYKNARRARIRAARAAGWTVRHLEPAPPKYLHVLSEESVTGVDVELERRAASDEANLAMQQLKRTLDNWKHTQQGETTFTNCKVGDVVVNPTNPADAAIDKDPEARAALEQFTAEHDAAVVELENQHKAAMAKPDAPQGAD